MSTKAKEPSEGDVIVARALSSYAQLRANIASWSGSGLPTTAAADNGKPDDENDELFTAESETAGVGYVTPQDSERSKTSTDKLRKQMLGKRARDGRAGLERVGGSKRTIIPRKGASQTARDDEDSEEDEGRSAVGKKRKHINVHPSNMKETNVDSSETNSVHIDGAGVVRKPPSSYLDELLAKRSQTRKRKKQKAKD